MQKSLKSGRSKYESNTCPALIGQGMLLLEDETMIEKLILLTRHGAVSGNNTTPMLVQEDVALTSVANKPGATLRVARIVGYGFISLGVVAGVAAVILLLIGAALIAPSFLHTLQSRLLNRAMP
jgi:hypothetical protein